MIVLRIRCNFFIVLPIRLNTCRPNGFLFLYKFGRVSDVFGVWARLIGIGRAILPGLLFSQVWSTRYSKVIHVKSPEIFRCTMVTLMYFNVYITGYCFHISFIFMVNCDDINILVEAFIARCSPKVIAKYIHKLFKNLKSWFEI